MKRKIMIIGALVLVVLAAGCSKKKSCRCAVRSSQADPQKVRIITVPNSFNCLNMNYVDYDQSEIQQDWRDTLLCTDYEFDIDSIFNK
ncbi:MAG: hypothetical protein MJZ51_03185 [Bacteroidales bacterium]|nr:hypothetical protein [Bacteroidales bacterium]